MVVFLFLFVVVSTALSFSTRTLSKRIHHLQTLRHIPSWTELKSTETDSDNNAVTTTGIETQLGENTRVKLKEEMSSPFRKLRLFIYAGSFIAGGLGTFTAIPQLIIAIKDASDKVPSVLGNIAIDVGAIVVAVIFWNRDTAEEKVKLARFAEKEKQMGSQLTETEKIEREQELAMMPVQVQTSEADVNVTRIVSFGDLQSKGKQHIIVVAGSQSFVKDAVISAKIEGIELFNNKETFIVPVVLNDNQLEGQDPSKGFGAPKETLMSAAYIGKPTQVNLKTKHIHFHLDSTAIV